MTMNNLKREWHIMNKLNNKIYNNFQIMTMNNLKREWHIMNKLNNNNNFKT